MPLRHAPQRLESAQGPGPRISYLVGRLSRALRKRLAATLQPFGLSVPQYTTLSVLQIRGHLSNAQLAKRAFISPQAMNEVIQGLEARALVSRRPSASHGRIVQLLLTRQGIDVMRRCDDAVGQLEHSMLAGLTHTELRSLTHALVTCTASLESHVISTRARAEEDGHEGKAPSP